MMKNAKTSILSILSMFKPFYYNFTDFFILHRHVIFPGSFENHPFGAFQHFSKTTSLTKIFKYDLKT